MYSAGNVAYNPIQHLPAIFLPHHSIRGQREGSLALDGTSSRVTMAAELQRRQVDWTVHRTAMQLDWTSCPPGRRTGTADPTATSGQSNLTQVRTTAIQGSISYVHQVVPTYTPNTWFLGTHESTTQTAAQCVHPFLQGTLVTDRPCYMCSNSLHLMLCTVMWPKKGH